MLQLVLVGTGDDKRLAEYVNVLRKELAGFVKRYSFRIYSTNTLHRAETKIELPEKGSRLSLRTGKDTDIGYWGVAGDVSIADLHSRWFGPLPGRHPAGIETIPYYSKANMRYLVHKWLAFPHRQENSSVFDLELDYKYIERDSEDACIVKLKLNESVFYPDPIIYFRSIISKLDSDFADVFLSAYVTTRMADFSADYDYKLRYDLDMIDTKILDIGLLFYVSRCIDKANNFNRLEDLELFKVSEQKNGTLYACNGNVEDFNRVLSSTDVLSFSKIIIPKYWICSWYELCTCEWFPMAAGQMVSVYNDRFHPANPDIVFSCGYTPDQLDHLPGLRDMSCQARYQAKELME